MNSPVRGFLASFRVQVQIQGNLTALGFKSPRDTRTGGKSSKRRQRRGLPRVPGRQALDLPAEDLALAAGDRAGEPAGRQPDLHRSAATAASASVLK